MGNDLNYEQVAMVCHEANRAYCQSLGDSSQPKWADVHGWQRDSAISGVKFHETNEATPEESHKNWLDQKVAEGWKYGEVKDVEKKEHPCCVDYSELPQDQKVKDYIFSSIVDAFKRSKNGN